MIKSGLLFVMLLFLRGAFAQSNTSFNHEISLTHDNDFLLITDQYYTAGLDLTYRHVLQQNSFLKQTDSSKLVTYFRLGNKMFTPKVIRTADIQSMDRPYAGWIFMNAGITRYKNERTADQLEFEVGLIGESSGMAKLQMWWHKKLGLLVPRGWASQIRDEVVINLNYQYAKQVVLTNGIDLMLKSAAYGGTGNNRLSQQIVLRAGDLNPLNQSVFFNGRVGSSRVKHAKEFFFYIGFKIDYVFSNIFIEGSLSESNPSPLTEKIVPLVTKNTYGVMHASNNSSFVFGVTFLSKEIERAQKHVMMVIMYAHRF